MRNSRIVNVPTASPAHRMDCTVSLSLPDAGLRLQFIVRGMLAEDRQFCGGGARGADIDTTHGDIRAQLDELAALLFEAGGKQQQLDRALERVWMHTGVQPLPRYLPAAHTASNYGVSTNSAHRDRGRSPRTTRGNNNTNVAVAAIDIDIDASPETHRPVSVSISSSAVGSAASAVRSAADTRAAATATAFGNRKHSLLVADWLRERLQLTKDDASGAGAGFAADSLDLLLCLQALLVLSERWSYRDLQQFLSAVKYDIMCDER